MCLSIAETDTEVKPSVFAGRHERGLISQRSRHGRGLVAAVVRQQQEVEDGGDEQAGGSSGEDVERVVCTQVDARAATARPAT